MRCRNQCKQTIHLSCSKESQTAILVRPLTMLEETGMPLNRVIYCLCLAKSRGNVLCESHSHSYSAEMTRYSKDADSEGYDEPLCPYPMRVKIALCLLNPMCEQDPESSDYFQAMTRSSISRKHLLAHILYPLEVGDTKECRSATETVSSPEGKANKGNHKRFRVEIFLMQSSSEGTNTLLRLLRGHPPEIIQNSHPYSDNLSSSESMILSGSRVLSPSSLRMMHPGSLVPPRTLVKLALPGADIRYMSSCISSEEASVVFRELLDSSLSWSWMGFGRQVAQWSEPSGLSYSFSERNFQAGPFPKRVLRLKNHLEHLLSRFFHIPPIFNYCVANFYSCSKSGVGWHSDAEDELVPESPIACNSLGAERIFGLKPRVGSSGGVGLRLQSGSLVVMAGDCQKNYLHSILTEENSTGPRISLTFRVHRTNV